MKITVIRHFPTEGNLKKRYIGKTDESIAKIIPNFDYSYLNANVVFVSPMKRAVETAEILFPKAFGIVIDEFAEMDFGIFENKNYLELKNCKEYEAWLDSDCESICPGGESKTEFCKRVSIGIEKLKKIAEALDIFQAVIVAHGGTAMAIGESAAKPKISYFDVKLSYGESITFDV